MMRFPFVLLGMISVVRYGALGQGVSVPLSRDCRPRLDAGPGTIGLAVERRIRIADLRRCARAAGGMDGRKHSE